MLSTHRAQSDMLMACFIQKNNFIQFIFTHDKESSKYLSFSVEKRPEFVVKYKRWYAHNAIHVIQVTNMFNCLIVFKLAHIRHTNQAAH